MKNYHQNREKGFTLVETFVAITILLIAVIGPLGLFSKALVDTIFAQNQITSLYLAQEGLELVINYKNNIQTDECGPDDFECLANTNPNQWLGELVECYGDEGCVISFDENNFLISPADVENQILNYDYSKNLYTHSVGNTSPTIFSRVIKIVPKRDPSNPDNIYAAEVVSESRWKDRRNNFSRNTKLETVIYNY